MKLENMLCQGLYCPQSPALPLSPSLLSLVVMEVPAKNITSDRDHILPLSGEEDRWAKNLKEFGLFFSPTVAAHEGPSPVTNKKSQARKEKLAQLAAQRKSGFDRKKKRDRTNRQNERLGRQDAARKNGGKTWRDRLNQEHPEKDGDSDRLVR